MLAGDQYCDDEAILLQLFVTGKCFLSLLDPDPWSDIWVRFSLTKEIRQNPKSRTVSKLLSKLLFLFCVHTDILLHKIVSREAFTLFFGMSRAMFTRFVYMS